MIFGTMAGRISDVNHKASGRAPVKIAGRVKAASHIFGPISTSRGRHRQDLVIMERIRCVLHARVECLIRIHLSLEIVNFIDLDEVIDI